MKNTTTTIILNCNNKNNINLEFWFHNYINNVNGSKISTSSNNKKKNLFIYFLVISDQQTRHGVIQSTNNSQLNRPVILPLHCSEGS